MSIIRVATERIVSAPPATTYRCIADYELHQAILPPQFHDFKIESGGVGAGTVITFGLETGGRARTYRMKVAEPEPGRVLTETDLQSSLVTTFTVVPKGDGSSVRIVTTWEGAGGVGGFFERTFAPRVLRRIYDDELARLDEQVRQARSSGQG